MHHLADITSHYIVGLQQCDQIKIAKCLQKLPKHEITRYCAAPMRHPADITHCSGKDHYIVGLQQCDQIKITKCLQKLPKHEFTRKMNDFDTFTNIA